jgi:DNA-binding IclR family transcriptional regulator
MGRTGSPASRHVAAVERAVAVLDVLAAGELGTNEVARRTGLNPSTASRQLATLVAAGFVAHVEETGRYRLGSRLVQLGQVALAGLDVRRLGRPHLTALADGSGETATLSVPGDPDAITVDFVLSPASVTSVARVGRPSIAHATATGKVALAFGRVQLPAGTLQPYTDRTIVDREELEAVIELVRKRGYAEAIGEREEDLNAVAAPVRNAGGELEAIVGLQGPASRFGLARLRAARMPLLAHVRSLSHELGALEL